MSQTLLPVVPRPTRVERRAGRFRLTPDTVIVSDERNRRNASYLRDLLAPPTGFQLPIRAASPPHNTAIVLNTDGEGTASYKLAISTRQVVISAAQATGVFYGLQTFRQLLPVEIERRRLVSGVEWSAPCLTIHDAPRFRWRGYMLDEGRHFHGAETVRRALELMALQKLNVFHWHLTEDQGWRIEIRRYPRLTEVGAVRRGTAKSRFGRCDDLPHGGFYTQDEIRSIVSYAAERHITVVPEIEMPGHSLAALASYPELSCTGGPFQVACRFGVMFDVYCAGKEATFEFLQNVLDEVMELFPSPYIHIGGDEVPKARWKRCPACRLRIKQEKLPNVHQLQVYFTNRIASYLARHGRRAVGWNQILQEGLDEGAVVQYWMGGRRRLVAALREGREVIASPYLGTYLDHSYALIPLRKAYRFEPTFPELDAASAHNVIGLEAPLWTEFVPDRNRLDYQTYPRLAAYAETGWSQGDKDEDDFYRRLEHLLSRLDELGVRYAPLSKADPPPIKQLFGIFTILSGGEL